MNATPYHQFIDLVRCDDQITVLSRTLERFTADATALEQEKLKNHITFELIHNAVRDMKKQLDAKELELSVARQKKSALEKKMLSISSAREYESLQHEQATIDKTLAVLEHSIMHSWEPYEKAKAALHDNEATYLQTAARLIAQEKKIEEQSSLVRETIGFLVRDRQNKVASVRQDWLETYESLKKSVNNPVVEMKLGACSGCFNQITSQLQIRVNRHEFVACPMCRRILYAV